MFYQPCLSGMLISRVFLCFKDWLYNALVETNIDLKTIFPKSERSDDQIMKVVQEMVSVFVFHIRFRRMQECLEKIYPNIQCCMYIT